MTSSRKFAVIRRFPLGLRRFLAYVSDRMRPTRRAVIDVGTNSIKLLVADVLEDEVRPILETSQQTRLGRGFYQTSRLQPDAIALTARGIGEFAAMARENDANEIRV